ncbi:MAG: hypothetical protein IPM10_07955 [Chitinophagaceae bacterium]|nr:hypothetical protein [Chitinophagaceae bacterium]
MKTDGSGNIYEDVANIRVTYKRQSNRTADKDWADTDVLSFRAYKNSDTDSLNMGAELTLKNRETILELIEALCKLYRSAT